MASYRFKARGADGTLVDGELAADSLNQAAQRLIATGVTPVEIHQTVAGTGSPLKSLSRRLGIGRIELSDLVMFSRQMYTVVKAGIPLLRGLRSLVSSTHNAWLRETLQSVLADLEGGRDLAASFARHPEIFPPLFVSIVRVGESTGTLENSFLRLTEHLAQEKDIRERVKGAMRYPVIVVLTILAAVIFISTFVIPKFEPIFRALQGDIPLPTRMVMGASTVIRDYWFMCLIAVAASAAAWQHHVSTAAGRLQWDRFKLRLPVIGRLHYEAALARVCRTLSICQSSGLPMIQALQVIGRSAGNAYLEKKIQLLTAGIERGDPLQRAATSSGLFSPLVLQMIAMGEETGELPSLLDEAAGFYEREVDVALKTLAASIEPILIGVVGGMVLILALGVFMPMWEMIGRTSVL
jgi:MSHA biogenesis protein MshG